MTTYRYHPVRQFLYTPELGAYLSYGIHVFALNGTQCAEAALISDVSPNLDFVISLAELCTELQLEPIHILDVILDAIS